MHEFTYYGQTWVYSALETFQNGIFKEDFIIISILQRLDIITALKKLESIRLSLRNQILTSEDENSTYYGNSDSDTTDSNNPPTPKGNKVTKSFLPRGVSSKAQLTDIIKSIHHLGGTHY